MLRTTLSKIKRVCNIAFIPRILQGDVKYAAQKKFTKHSMISSQAGKSTSSNSGATDNNETNSNKQPEVKADDNVQKFNEESLRDEPENVQKYNEEMLAEERKTRDRLINKIFPPGDPLYATPRDNEGLEQKIEHLKEIETGVPSPLEEEKERDTNLYYNPNKYDTKYDEIAHRCLTSPPKKVDDHIFKELGVESIPDGIDFYPQKPTQSYYSEVLYGKPQVIRYKKEVSKPIELQRVSCITDLYVDKACKAELIQPLIFDSISLCEGIDKDREKENFDALEDTQLTPVFIDPYANQSFAFHNYGIEEDIMLENPIQEESITITAEVDDVRNNNLIPPTEMEVESDQGNVREKVESAFTGLASPGETASIDTISSMVENENYVLYTQPTSGPPGEGPGTLHRQPEKVVKPKTAISSKSKEEKQSNPTNSSISDNQNPNDSDNINRITRAQERTDFLLNMPANVFPGNPSNAEDVKEPVYARKTIVSYIEGTYKRPIIEIKIPVYNMKETEQSIKESTVHFKETDDGSQNIVSYATDGNESCVQAPNKIPEMEKYERPVSHIEVCEKTPHTEKPVLNVRVKPEYEAFLKNKKVQQNDSNLDTNLTATGPIPNVVQEEVTLNELLRRIRERHRLELCRDYYNQLTSMTMTETCSKPGTLGPNPCKGKDKSPCPPPPKCPPTTQKDPCAPKKDPCAPKKDPCKKRDPCAKFINSKIYDTISLLRIYFLSDFRSVNCQYRQYSSQVFSSGSVQFRALNNVLKDGTDTEKDVILARDYEPWIPIPSWPIPKKEKRRPFVCPKDGCKLLPSPPFDPAFKDKPCVSFPKKKFCLSDLFEHPVLNYKES